MRIQRSDSLRFHGQIGSVLALSLALSGCATQSWTKAEIERVAGSLRADIDKQTQEARAELREATAQNKAAYDLTQRLSAESRRLEKALAELKESTAALKSHVEAALAQKDAALTAAMKTGDREVHDAVTKEHQATIDAMRKQMQEVEQAGQKADELARTLSSILEAYKAANEKWSKKE